MHDGETGLPPAGWYPDTRDVGSHRWWDGQAWTAHVTRPEPEGSVAQPAAEQVTRRQLREQAAGEPVRETQLASLALLDRPAEISSREYARRAAGYEPRATDSVRETAATQVIVYGSPNTVSGWFFAVSPAWYGGVNLLASALFPAVDRPALALPSLIGVLVLFWGLARTDGKHLQERGYRPTSAWWILVPLVYFILRTARTGSRGAAMLVTYLLLQLLIIVVVFVTVFAALAAYQQQQSTDASSQATPFAQSGDPTAGTPQALSDPQREFLLTPDGMLLGVSNLLTGDAVTVQQCEPFASTEQGATTHCLVLSADGQYDVTLSLTPQYADTPYEVLSITPLNGQTETPTLES
jgi:hypothetical protein